jgi:hypothetical protein
VATEPTLPTAAPPPTEEEEIYTLLAEHRFYPVTWPGGSKVVEVLAAWVREQKVAAYMEGQEAAPYAPDPEIGSEPRHEEDKYAATHQTTSELFKPKEQNEGRWRVVINLGTRDGLFTMMLREGEVPTFPSKEGAQVVANRVQARLGGWAEVGVVQV